MMQSYSNSIWDWKDTGPLTYDLWQGWAVEVWAETFMKTIDIGGFVGKLLCNWSS